MKELSERQERAIQMLCTGDYTKVEIAQEVGVDRATIYNWLKDKAFVAQLDTALQDIKTQSTKEFTSKLPKAIQEYWKICTQSTDVRTKEKALAWWMERSGNDIRKATELLKDIVLAILRLDPMKEDINRVTLKEQKFDSFEVLQYVLSATMEQANKIASSPS
ncbi:MAG: phBC6A51 family helix-turn-helix protein [Bacillota bacterium]